ncbi:hypothetical protein PWT90_07077 [Aphanocladium album]|nr:hypothetical protein PWT90_07077 [Aphanocladium album]
MHHSPSQPGHPAICRMHKVDAYSGKLGILAAAPVSRSLCVANSTKRWHQQICSVCAAVHRAASAQQAAVASSMPEAPAKADAVIPSTNHFAADPAYREFDDGQGALVAGKTRRTSKYSRMARC